MMGIRTRLGALEKQAREDKNELRKIRDALVRQDKEMSKVQEVISELRGMTSISVPKTEEELGAFNGSFMRYRDRFFRIGASEVLTAYLEHQGIALGVKPSQPSRVILMNSLTKKVLNDS
jgi:hypothetical protein